MLRPVQVLRVPARPEKVASVDFNLTTGRIKALRGDACLEVEHVDNGRCHGWCVHARLVPAEHACRAWSCVLTLTNACNPGANAS